VTGPFTAGPVAPGNGETKETPRVITLSDAGSRVEVIAVMNIYRRAVRRTR
jgi:hypothetical protein